MKKTMIASAACAIFFAAAIVIYYLAPFKGESANWYRESQVFLASGFAAIAAVLATRHLVKGDPYKRVWRYISAGLALWAIGNAVSSVQAILRVGHFPSPAMLFWFIGYFPYFIGLVIGLKTLGAKPTGVSIFVSVIVIGIALLDYIFFLVTPILGSQISTAEKFLSVIYPIEDLLLLVPVIFTLLTMRFEVPSWPMKLLAAGIGFTAAADSLFAYVSFYRIYAYSPVNLLWIAGYLIVGVTAVSQIEASHEPKAYHIDLAA